MRGSARFLSDTELGERAMSKAVELTTQSFDQAVSSGVTLVDFWAEWCGPCRMLAPVVDEIAGEYTGRAKVAKVNIDNEGDLAARYRVNSIPTLLVIKDGQEKGRLVGVQPKAKIAAALDLAAS